MKSSTNGFAGIAALAIGIGVLSVSTSASADDGLSDALCGSDDTPETGFRGDVPLADQVSGRAEQGYNCGLAVIGYNDFGGAGARDLAWSGQCAYVGGGGGFRVIDVSDPSAPVVTETIPFTFGTENLHAVTTAERAVLVTVGRRAAAEEPVPVHVWDVRNCTEPVPLGVAHFPGFSVHNVTMNEDGTQIWGSLPLQVADISNLADPGTWTVTNWQCEVVAAGTRPGFTGLGFFPQTAFAVDRLECGHQLAHEFAFNAAGTRMYIGGQLPESLGESRDPLGHDWNTEQQLFVVDLSVTPPEIIGETEPASGHGIRRATIGGKPFLIHSNENVFPGAATANGCFPDTELPVLGAAQAFLTDITDETAPQVISELELGINDPASCAAQAQSGVKSTIHYNEVDDPDDTTFAMLPMGNAGLRLFAVRDAEEPVEVAYFDPGMFRQPDGSLVLDRAGNHTHLDTRQVSCGEEPEASETGNVAEPCERGYIWPGSAGSGCSRSSLRSAKRSACPTTAMPLRFPMEDRHGPPGSRPARYAATPLLRRRRLSAVQLPTRHQRERQQPTTETMRRCRAVDQRLSPCLEPDRLVVRWPGCAPYGPNSAAV